MRVFVCVAAATLAFGGVARAQTPAAAAGETSENGYAEIVLQSAFVKERFPAIHARCRGVEAGHIQTK